MYCLAPFASFFVTNSIPVHGGLRCDFVETEISRLVKCPYTYIHTYIHTYMYVLKFSIARLILRSRTAEEALWNTNVNLTNMQAHNWPMLSIYAVSRE